MSNTQMSTEHETQIPSPEMVDEARGHRHASVRRRSCETLLRKRGVELSSKRGGVHDSREAAVPAEIQHACLCAKSYDRIRPFLVADSARLSCRFGSRAIRQPI